MKKIILRLTFVLAVSAAVLLFSGCTKENESKRSENTINFARFTQQERKDYINDFLWENYGFRGEISEVKQKPINFFRLEDNYFATVRADGKELISVWVSDKGEIFDTFFLQGMQPEFEEFFSAYIANRIPKFKISVSTDLYEIPEEKPENIKDIKEMLKDRSYQTCLRVFVDDGSLINEQLLEELKQELSFCSAIVYIYICDDLENLDMETYIDNPPDYDIFT